MINQPVVIDASTLLNLLATGEAEAILCSLTVDKFVCSAVASEVMYIRSAHPDYDVREETSIDPLVEAGLLAPAKVQTSKEEAQFVDLAATLDDGEAMSLAICTSRGYVLATDDRKARRTAETLPTRVPLLATSEMVLYWAQRNSIPSNRVRNALVAIDVRGRFRPWNGYPLRDWWLELLQASP